MIKNTSFIKIQKNDVVSDDEEEEEEEEDEEEEDEDEEEEEEELFYESLDRIASSSCSCSTSNSDSEPDPNPSTRSGSPYVVGVGTTSHYDIWISQPDSVSERRRRLLLQMGLSSDPSLSRRSVSYSDRLTREHNDPDCVGSSSAAAGIGCGGGGIARSKSEGAGHDLGGGGGGDGERGSDDSGSGSGSVNLQKDGDFVDVNSLRKSGNGKLGNGSSPKGMLGGSNKPPTGKNGVKRLDVGRSHLMNLNGNLSNGEIAEELESDGDVALDVQVCTIRNLDNGEEFVVNEIREDGMWNKLKEVGTGRQLTLEEFEMTVGHSPIVQELMRRQNVEEGGSRETHESNGNAGIGGGVSKLKKKGGWFKSIKSVASSMTGHRERRSSDERDTGSEKGGRRSSSATDDSQDVSFHGPERVRVRQYGKSFKELSALYKSQEIQAHNGSIWSIKFSLDGRYLASAGEDCVIHVWEVVESDRRGELLTEKQEDAGFNLLLANGSPEPSLLSPKAESFPERRRKGRPSLSRKSLSLDHIIVPETVFALTDKPICSFLGHLDDVLDLSWSKSQDLLSSSMDKTVRLWRLSSKTCLKIFSHSDYVTCIQFNPVDDRYFISGSLDAKVRIWSIPDRQVVDWTDLHEMVTAACYTPDGQGALVGSYKGSCRLYNASGTCVDNKLQQKCQISLQNKKKKAHLKKITGFQFAPGSSSEVLVTSADSRIRVIDGADLVHKFKGFRNTNSQIAASLTSNGKYVVSASEDSYVYVWKHEADSRPSRSKGVTVARSYEHFHCQDVSVAIPWPGMAYTWGLQDSYSGGESDGVDNRLDEASVANHPPTPVEDTNGNEGLKALSGCTNSPLNGFMSSATNGYLFDRFSATWPEEKLIPANRTRSPCASVDFSNQNMSAYGMVIVTAGLRGEIRTYQNFGLPVRI